VGRPGFLIKRCKTNTTQRRTKGAVPFGKKGAGVGAPTKLKSLDLSKKGESKVTAGEVGIQKSPGENRGTAGLEFEVKVMPRRGKLKPAPGWAHVRQGEKMNLH